MTSLVKELIFLYQTNLEAFWGSLDVALLLLLGVVKCLYPWKPEWKSERTKDKDGNEITKYYHLDE